MQKIQTNLQAMRFTKVYSTHLTLNTVYLQVMIHHFTCRTLQQCASISASGPGAAAVTCLCISSPQYIITAAALSSQMSSK